MSRRSKLAPADYAQIFVLIEEKMTNVIESGKDTAVTITTLCPLHELRAKVTPLTIAPTPAEPREKKSRKSRKPSPNRAVINEAAFLQP